MPEISTACGRTRTAHLNEQLNKRKRKKSPDLLDRSSVALEKPLEVHRRVLCKVSYLTVKCLRIRRIGRWWKVLVAIRLFTVRYLHSTLKSPLWRVVYVESTL